MNVERNLRVCKRLRNNTELGLVVAKRVVIHQGSAEPQFLTQRFNSCTAASGSCKGIAPNPRNRSGCFET
jgi:hypothetical protein